MATAENVDIAKLVHEKGVTVSPMDWGRPGSLTTEELAVYCKFRDEIEKRGKDFRDTVYSFGEVEGESNALCRWLRARKFKYDAVITMVEEATECRKKPKEDDFYPDPKAALGVDPHVYIAQYPQLYFGSGRNGCPIFISKPGLLNINAIECITTFPGILRYHWWSMMHDYGNRIRENKRKNESIKSFEFNIIMDLGGLSASTVNSRTLSVLKEQAFIDSLCFPETMSRMIIVNAPRFFSATWKIIKKWIDPRTAGKVEIIASRKTWEKRLLEIFDADQLPSDYGGTGNTSDYSMLMQNTDGDIKRFHTDLISVRSSTSTTFELQPGEKMNVFVYTKAKYGATFSLLDNAGIKPPFAQNVDVTFNGDDEDLDNAKPTAVTLGSGITGPGVFKVKVESKSSRVYSYNYLLVYNVYKS